MIFIRNEPGSVASTPTTSPTRSTRRSMTPRTPSRGTAGGPPANCWPPRSVWLAAITTGFFQICSVGVMSQLVIRNTQLGFSQQAAMNVMTILALGGVVGSWLVGVIDDAIGTKKTMVMFGIWYAIALLLNFTAVDSVTPLVYVSLFMIAMGIGAPPTSPPPCHLHLWPPGFRQGEQCHLPHPVQSLPCASWSTAWCRRLPAARSAWPTWCSPAWPGERAPGADGQRAQVQPRLDGGPQEVSCTASEPLQKSCPRSRGDSFFRCAPCPILLY